MNLNYLTNILNRGFSQLNGEKEEETTLNIIIY